MMLAAWRFGPQGWFAQEEIPLSDRGFRYGASVFETLLLTRRGIMFLAEHTERFSDACAALAGTPVQVPPFRDLERLAATELEESDGTAALLRFVYSAGIGSVREALSDGEFYAHVEVTDPSLRPPSARVVVASHPILPVLNGHKCGSYLPNVLAFQEAVRAGADEAVVADPFGWILGVSMGNLFLRIDGQWKTPACSGGVRDGVVRAWVRSRMEVAEARIALDELDGVDAAFITNSRVGVFPVAVLKGRAIELDAQVLRLDAEFGSLT